MLEHLIKQLRDSSACSSGEQYPLPKVPPPHTGPYPTDYFDVLRQLVKELQKILNESLDNPMSEL